MADPIRMVYLGTPEFAATILESLAKANLSPIAVYTQEAKPVGRSKALVPTAVAQMAERLGIACSATADINRPEMVQSIAALNPDLIVVVAFGQLLKQIVLDLPRLYCLNVHGSLLPAYRGAAPLQRAIADGLTETGISIQKMVKRLDAGDILWQRRFPIHPSDTSGTLMVRAATEGASALLEALELVQTGRAKFTPQNEQQVSFARKLSREESELDFQRSAIQLANQIRALNPWPGAETKLDGKRVKVLHAEAIPHTSAQIGKILTDSKTYIHIGCAGGGLLSLTEIQPENKKKLSVKEFLVGFRGSFPFQQVG